MAADKPNSLGHTAYGFNSLPVVRQIWIVVAVAATLAIGITAGLWTYKPSMKTLYSELAEKDINEVTNALTKAGIAYELSGSGAVLVPDDQVYNARIKLASQGLPNGSAKGFDVLDKETRFGTSQFMETARYQHALESELAMTIASMRGVENARVHLALPKQSVFVRNQRPASASVFVNLFSGRNLDDGQVSSIAHLVASSVPNLEHEHVAVIDQSGRLLSAPTRDSEVGISGTQFTHRKQVEEYLTARIESLIAPIVGVGGVRAQVTADLDFSTTEQTQESFNPDLPAVRSEQTMEESADEAGAAGGVPGALTNQPPAGGTTGEAQKSAGTKTSKSNKQTTRNYEVDRTISHVKLGSGSVRRLSIAVVIDDKQTTAEGGEVTRTPLKEDEIARMTSLVKEAVGFDARRGDTISVVNSAFNMPPPSGPLPEVPLKDQPWVWEAAKILGVVLLAAIVLMGVIRPFLRSLAEKGASIPSSQLAELRQLSQEQLQNLSGPNSTQALPAGAAYENQLTQARTMVQQDPKLVAQVVKQWVGDDG